MPQTSDQSAVKQASAQDQLQLVIFSLHGEEFACNLTDAREIMDTTTITPVPNVHAAIKGIVNVRGKVMSVIDLATVFHFQEVDVKKSHIIVADKGNEVFGILVDEVKEVLRGPKTMLQPAPDVLQSRIDQNYIHGIITLDPQMTEGKAAKQLQSRIILVLDLVHILADFSHTQP